MPEIDELDLETTDEACPKCGELLFVNHVYIKGPENPETWLICKNCNYMEKE